MGRIRWIVSQGKSYTDLSYIDTPLDHSRAPGHSRGKKTLEQACFGREKNIETA